ncbi:MAG: glycosyltransferase family 2 protein [Chitinophagaceae bacterium]|nr:glycosyltransferase family 2 protein [Chitinophagaceae bacterium]
MKLSIVIPCYNEVKLILPAIQKVLAAELPAGVEREIILVNDGSHDGTKDQIENLIAQNPALPLILCHHPVNRGKGASIRTALEKVNGEVVVIQDADLEYDPRDLQLMLEPILDDKADVVFGSRFMGTGPHRVLFYFHTIGNKFLTFLSNLFTQLNLTDMETGYKMFRTHQLRSIRLVEDRFGFEPEVTAKISRLPGVRIYETGIRYYGRTYQDGKKIRWPDGFRSMYCILKYNLISRS